MDIPKPRGRGPKTDDKARFIRRSRYDLPVRLRLDFDRPVTIAEMRATARRLLDALALESRGAGVEPPFAEAHFVCAELARSIRIPSEPAE